MKKLRFLLFSVISVLSIIGLQAQTFESGGINYTKYHSDIAYDNAVYVDKPAEGAKYAGDIRIPNKVSYDNKEYWVGGVGNDAFKGCTEMTSCVFEGTIEWIGNNAFEGCTGLKKFTIPPISLIDIYIDKSVYLGYRAFWGCHLDSLTCMSGNPPYYKYTNPSWNAGSWVSSPSSADWIGWEMNDHWRDFNTTTLYVPAGTLGAYSKTSEGNYRDKWGDYFSVIKEWGVEDDDPVPGLYDDINEVKPLCDEAILSIINYSYMAYYDLLDYISGIAEKEGRDITALQEKLDASFETISLYLYKEGEGEGWHEYKVIPKHKNSVLFFQNTLSEAQEKLDKMQEKRKAYYQARRSGDSSAESMKAELATLAAEVEELIKKIKMSLEALNMEDIGKDCQEFVENFKKDATPVEVIKYDSNSLTPQWYNIQGQRLPTAPIRRGVYIRNGKKVTVK